MAFFRRSALFIVAATFVASLGWAQPPKGGAPPAGGAGNETVEANPIECWWRTSTGAVRIGERFTLVLTCAVLDNPAITVVPDQSRLDSSVMQLAPFEVIGGKQSPDLWTDERRFFQYEYQLRLIGETHFGKDVKFPDTTITYKVRSQVAEGAVMDSRDRPYVLPPLSIRVLSLVPSDAPDIRDASTETFGDLDVRTFRANAYLTAAVVVFTLAALFVILAVVQLATRRRAPAGASAHLIADSEVLRDVARELAAIQSEREGSGWTHDLAGRALAALRLAASYALSQRVSQRVTANADGHGGALTLRAGKAGKAGKKGGGSVLVSGAVTPQVVREELTRLSAVMPERPEWLEFLQGLERALTRLTVAHYGREGALDDSTLDESLATTLSTLRRLRAERTWRARTIAAFKGRSIQPEGAV